MSCIKRFFKRADDLLPKFNPDIANGASYTHARESISYLSDVLNDSLSDVNNEVVRAGYEEVFKNDGLQPIHPVVAFLERNKLTAAYNHGNYNVIDLSKVSLKPSNANSPPLEIAHYDYVMWQLKMRYKTDDTQQPWITRYAYLDVPHVRKGNLHWIKGTPFVVRPILGNPIYDLDRKDSGKKLILTFNRKRISVSALPYQLNIIGNDKPLDTHLVVCPLHSNGDGNKTGKSKKSALATAAMYLFAQDGFHNTVAKQIEIDPEDVKVLVRYPQEDVVLEHYTADKYPSDEYWVFAGETYAETPRITHLRRTELAGLFKNYDLLVNSGRTIRNNEREYMEKIHSYVKMLTSMCNIDGTLNEAPIMLIKKVKSELSLKTSTFSPAGAVNALNRLWAEIERPKMVVAIPKEYVGEEEVEMVAPFVAAFLHFTETSGVSYVVDDHIQNDLDMYNYGTVESGYRYKWDHEKSNDLWVDAFGYIYKEGTSMSKSRVDMINHLYSINNYMDATTLRIWETIENTGELGPLEVGNLKPILEWSVKFFERRWATEIRQRNVLYNQHLSVLGNLHQAIIHAMNYYGFDLKNTITRTMSDNVIDPVLGPVFKATDFSSSPGTRKTLKPPTVYGRNTNLSKSGEHPECSAHDKITANHVLASSLFIARQDTTMKAKGKQGGKKGPLRVDDPKNHIHPSFAGIGSYMYTTKSEPLGLCAINPYVVTSAWNRAYISSVSPDESIMDKLREAEKLIMQETYPLSDVGYEEDDCSSEQSDDQDNDDDEID